jgi:hypothetical protein
VGISLQSSFEACEPGSRQESNLKQIQLSSDNNQKFYFFRVEWSGEKDIKTGKMTLSSALDQMMPVA